MKHIIRNNIQPITKSVVASNLITRSPLRYPGGKSRAVPQIMKLIPTATKTLCSPFFGGGSVELACTLRGIQVHGYDNFSALVDFWDVLIKQPDRLYQVVMQYFPLSKHEFYRLQKEFGAIKDKIERAAVFYVLNRASYSGTTLSGGMSPDHPRFTKSSIDRLKDFMSNSLSVECLDFVDSLPKHQNDFLYLDPPYANGGSLYGIGGNMHKDFDHAALADILRSRDSWILSYNDCAQVRGLYKGFSLETPVWAYGMNSNKSSNELLILSKDIGWCS